MSGPQPSRLRLVSDDAEADEPDPGARADPPTLPDSFADAFRANYSLVHRMLRSYGVEAALLDDAAQEVFMIVHRRWEDYDGRAAFRRWLFGITRRVAADYRRSLRRYRRRVDKLPPPPEPVDPEQRVQSREQIEMVERFLASLGELHREAFVLSEVEGMSGPEIAEILGVKLNTVYSRIRVARERFTAFLDDQRGAHG